MNASPLPYRLRGSAHQACLIGFRPRATKPETKVIFHVIFSGLCGLFARGTSAMLIAVNVLKNINGACAGA
jgi:hypothetical protein